MKINKYNYSLLLLMSFILQIHTVPAQLKHNYNVLFIAVDDMNDRIDFLGSPEVNAPNMQRLLKHGMLFTHAYSQFPLCNPSRTAVLTGWRPDKTGVFDLATHPRSVLSPEVKFLPEYFKQYGYRIERYGKIMHNSFENDIMWDYAEPPEIKERSDTSLVPPGSWWVTNVLNDSVLYDGKRASHLVQRLKQSQTQPFFYALGLVSTHESFTPRLNYWNRIGDPLIQELLPEDANGTTDASFKGNGSSNIGLPSTPANDRDDVPPIAFSNFSETINKPDSEWRRTIHAYEGEVFQMDAQLGLVLDEIDRQQLWKNTIIIFWSDHGQHLGEHLGLWRKQTLFEESLHVPLIVCAPGKRTGICSKFVELEDIYPTLLELSSLPLLSNLQGSSFVPLLDDPDFKWKRAVFSQQKRVLNDSLILMGRSIRTEQYRYTSWDTLGEELYDHCSDPHEYTNLAGNTNYKSILDSMRKILDGGWEKSSPPLYELKTFYKDLDKDGYGNFNDSIHAYAKPIGYVADHSDCNDSNANIYPTPRSSCNSLSLYPNPSNGNITVTYHSNVIGKISLIIFDARGKLVFTSSDVVDTKGSLVKKLNLFNFQSGAYYLSIYNSEEESHASFSILK